MIIRWLIGGAVLMSVSGAQAAERTQCLTAAEAQAVAMVLLPDAAEAVGKQCAGSLPASATLREGLPPLVARWHAEGAASTAIAGVAVGKMAGGLSSGSAADGAAMLQLVRSSMIADMVKSISPKTCAIVEGAVKQLAPLPAANLAGLVVLAMQQGGGGRGALICEPPRP